MPDSETADQTGTEEQGGQTAQQPTAEDHAIKMGWNPEYDGPDKIDAGEFIRRAPLFEKIKGQSRELKEVKKLMEGMATTFKAVTTAQYNKGIADAEAKMKAAEAEFDVAAYKQAQSEKTQLETAKAATSAPASEPPEVTEFCERNPWFEKDRGMRTDALDYREKFIKSNPDASIAETLEYVERRMKKDYPEAFEAKETTTKKPAGSAVEGASPSSHTDPLNKLKASMSAEEKRIMKMFVKDGGLTEKEYLTDYATVRGA
jgi:uncharacterized membrane protein